METTQILSTCSRIFCIKKKVRFFWAFKTKDQCALQLKPSKLGKICIALQKNCFCFFLINPHGEKVVPYIFC